MRTVIRVVLLAALLCLTSELIVVAGWQLEAGGDETALEFREDFRRKRTRRHKTLNGNVAPTVAALDCCLFRDERNVSQYIQGQMR